MSKLKGVVLTFVAILSIFYILCSNSKCFATVEKKAQHVKHNNKKVAVKVPHWDPDHAINWKAINQKQKKALINDLSTMCFNEKIDYGNIWRIDACYKAGMAFFSGAYKLKTKQDSIDAAYIYLKSVCIRVDTFVNEHGGFPADNRSTPDFWGRCILSCNTVAVMAEKNMVSDDLFKHWKKPYNKESMITHFYWLACNGGYQSACDNQARRASKSNEPSL